MIYVIIALALSAVGNFFQIKGNRKKNNEISGLKDEVYNLVATVEDRNHTIHRMEEINLETAKKKKKLNTGDDNIDFNNSLDILSDNSADSGASKD